MSKLEEDILKRNVADLEIALKRQTERAETAEAELLAVRDDNHAMMLEIEGLRNELAKLREQEPLTWGTSGELIDILKNPIYSAPTPAPAVPAEWREVMAELTADVKAACDAEHPHRDQYPSVMRKYNNDMQIVERARALLQSAPKAIDGVEN